VLSLSDPAEPRVAGWLEAMQKDYRVRKCRTLVVDMAELKAKPRTEHYFVYEFVPKGASPQEQGEGDRIRSASVPRTSETARK
jgi:hypothetical protein